MLNAFKLGFISFHSIFFSSFWMGVGGWLGYLRRGGGLNMEAIATLHGCSLTLCETGPSRLI